MLHPPPRNRRGVWLGAAIALALGAAAVLPALRPLAHAARPPLEVTRTWWTPLQYGGESVSGMVRNNSDTTFAQVRVELDFFAPDGKLLGTHGVTLRNVPAHHEQEFETWLLPWKVHHYKLRADPGDDGRLTARLSPARRPHAAVGVSLTTTAPRR